MKKKKYLLAVGACCLVLLSGCQNESSDEPKEEPAENITINTEDDEKEDASDAQENQENQEDQVQETINLTIYVPNANYDGLEQKTIEVDEKEADTIWQALKNAGVFTDESAVNTANLENGVLKLDVNQTFGDTFSHMGTAEETMVLQSIVNTYLDAYECEKMVITVDGNTLVSGHKEYAGELTR